MVKFFYVQEPPPQDQKTNLFPTSYSFL